MVFIWTIARQSIITWLRIIAWAYSFPHTGATRGIAARPIAPRRPAAVYWKMMFNWQNWLIQEFFPLFRGSGAHPGIRFLNLKKINRKVTSRNEHCSLDTVLLRKKIPLLAFCRRSRCVMALIERLNGRRRLTREISFWNEFLNVAVN